MDLLEHLRGKDDSSVCDSAVKDAHVQKFWKRWLGDSDGVEQDAGGDDDDLEL